MTSRKQTQNVGGHRPDDIVDNVLQGATLTLQIVQQAATLTTMPYLSDAAGLVLKVFEIVQVRPVHYYGLVLVFKSQWF